MFFNTGILPIIVLSISTMCSNPDSMSITNSDMQYSYGIISQYNDINGELSASSHILNNNRWSTGNAVANEDTNRSVKVTLNITKVSKFIPFFDFEEEYEEI